MRLSFIGSSLVSCYWNGAATYYRGLLRALAARGHQVTFLEPDAFGRQQNRDMPDPDWARVVVWPATQEGMERAVDIARGADLVVKASGVGVFDRELEAAVLTLRRPGNLVAFWDVDAPATLDRVEGDPADPFRPLIPAYDLVFTYGGGDPVVRAYERLGARECVPIYNALDPATHHPVPPDQRYAADLGFLGNRLPDREARVGSFFLEPAAALPDRRFLLGGAGWNDKPMPPNVRYLGHVGTGDHNAFNSSALAVLNINRASMAAYGFSPPTRVFEAAGAGACLITDAWEGIEQFLEPGREVLVAHDGAQVAEHLAALDPARSHTIGGAALKRVLAQHTYAQRALLVEAALDGRWPQETAA
jgi:spore maturation protein CgeB